MQDFEYFLSKLDWVYFDLVFCTKYFLVIMDTAVLRSSWPTSHTDYRLITEAEMSYFRRCCVNYREDVRVKAGTVQRFGLIGAFGFLMGLVLSQQEGRCLFYKVGFGNSVFEVIALLLVVSHHEDLWLDDCGYTTRHMCYLIV